MKGKFPNGLAAAMKRAGIGPTELARLADTNKQNILRWRDQERKLTPEIAKSLSPHLDTTPEDLVFAVRSEVFASVPLVEWVTAGKLAEPRSQIPVADVPLLAFADLGRGDFFALKVEGDSMDRISPEGSTIVVNRAERRPVNGRAYIFSIKGETTFKRWHPGKPPYLAPYSINPVHTPIFFREKDLEVVGRVVRTMMDL